MTDVGVGDGAEQRGGGRVDRVHRPRDKQGEDFQRPGFPRAGLGDRNASRGVESKASITWACAAHSVAAV